MSFITDLARSGIPTQSQLDKSMRARVAPTSIWAQKIVDDTTASEISIHRLLGEQLITDRPMYGAAHADLKGGDKGIRGSFLAAQAYAQEAKDQRDELLAKYGK